VVKLFKKIKRRNLNKRNEYIHYKKIFYNNINIFYKIIIIKNKKYVKILASKHPHTPSNEIKWKFIKQN